MAEPPADIEMTSPADPLPPATSNHIEADEPSSQPNGTTEISAGDPTSEPAQAGAGGASISTPTRASQPTTTFATPQPPDRPAAHGSPTRVYLNQNVTPHLLEGMKYIAAYEPEKPLRWLSEFLAKRSAELEGQ